MKSIGLYYSLFLEIIKKAKLKIDWVSVDKLNCNLCLKKDEFDLKLDETFGSQLYPIPVIKYNGEFYVIDFYNQFELFKKFKYVKCILIEDENLFNFLNGSKDSNLEIKDNFEVVICDLANKYFTLYPKEEVDINKNLFSVKIYNYLSLLEALSIFPKLINNYIIVYTFNKKYDKLEMIKLCLKSMIPK